jgi:LmbE family N-acetylglucosaminyl deacetylase
MRILMSLILLTVFQFSTSVSSASQQTARTLVAVLAHADDESAVGPILARYAREGVRVHLVIVTDGAQGGMNTTIPRGPELARARAEEARCSAAALASQPPVLLEFPDGKLGDYAADPSLLYRVTERVAAELARIRPDAIVTWGPDGGTGHADHRLVSNIVAQLVRAGAPGATDNLHYMYLPREAIEGMRAGRVPPFLFPEARHFTTRVPFEPRDLDAAQKAMRCHRTQFPEEALARMLPPQAAVYRGAIALVPAFSTDTATSLFGR